MFSGQDAWRKHHLITGCARNPLPGLGTALIVFAGYCVAEAGYNYVTGTAIITICYHFRGFCRILLNTRRGKAYIFLFLLYQTALPKSAPRATMNYQDAGDCGDTMTTGELKRKGGHH